MFYADRGDALGCSRAPAGSCQRTLSDAWLPEAYSVVTVVASALTAETDLSRGADVATTPAISRINQHVDADVVAVGESRIAAMVAGALATEADLSSGTGVATQPTVGRVSLAVDADVVAEAEALLAGSLPHEEAVPSGASALETGLPLGADVAACAAVVHIVLEIEANSAAVRRALRTNHGRRSRWLRRGCRCFSWSWSRRFRRGRSRRFRRGRRRGGSRGRGGGSGSGRRCRGRGRGRWGDSARNGARGGRGRRAFATTQRRRGGAPI